VDDAARILEVGCGTGLATEELRRVFPQAEITGIDILPVPGRLFRATAQGSRSSAAHWPTSSSATAAGSIWW